MMPAAPAVAALRPVRETIDRRSPLTRPVALSLADGECPQCGNEVLEHEPIVCVGSTLATSEDGTKHVDLADAEWVCQRCGFVQAGA